MADFEKGSEADHDAKRPLTEYAFKLLQEADIGYPTSQVHQNIIASPKTCDPSQDLRKESNVCRKSHQAPRVSPQGGSKVQVDEESSRNIQPRRFHLSGVTKDAESGSVLRPRGHHNKISKHSRAGAPLFTERRALSPASQQKLLQAATIETDKSQPQSGAMDIDESLQDLSVQKKPGTRDRPGPDDSISGRNTSARDPVNIDPSVLQIFSEMQEQYERELQEPSKHNGVRPLKPRLRPRIPARRRKEDHEAISKPSEIADTMDTDGPENNDYVYDTYVRYRTDQSSSQTDDLTSGNRTFGILIIDEDDQSLWEEFVDDEGDSDKDLNDDEEDENGMYWMNCYKC